MAFYKLQNKSEKKYGVSSVRPQDMDKEMKIVTRRNNLGIFPPVPYSYALNLQTLPDRINVQAPAAPLRLNRFEEQPMIEWIDSPQKTAEVCKELMGYNYIGVDFEFHTKDSYEGKN